jgi:succinyl-diaminopimelate desuccinylase
MDLAATLELLVNIPSETGSEDRIATTIAERLLPIWTSEGVERIGNSLVVGRRTGRPLISLYGHIDTVPEQQSNGKARTVGGRMLGLGTADMKSGVAVMIHLLEDAEIRSGDYDLVGVFYDGEEGGSDQNGLEEVLVRAPWLVESEFGLVLEPTDLTLEIGCNGSMNADVIFRGRAAHSARPWLGENAVTKAGRWLARLHDLEPRTETIAGLDYHEVFTITRAGGGIANNVVPADFTVNLNYRFPPSLTVAEAETRLHELAAPADEVVVRDSAPAGGIPQSNPHLARFEDLVGGERKPKQGWTDVARLGEHGIPAVNYGPGDPSEAHQAGESVSLANLGMAYSVVRAFLRR